jgi:hypothetical protein
MKNGVYINKNKDLANLVIIDGENFIDGNAVSTKDYALACKFDQEERVFTIRIASLEYLGEL